MANGSYPPFHPASNYHPDALTRKQFRTLFPDESHYVEWKEGISRKKIQEAVVAFSNADGGVVMIGIDDRGNPKGRKLNADAEKSIWEIVNQLESPGNIKLSNFLVDETESIAISVEKRQQGISQTSDGRPLIRRGKQNLPLMGAALVELVAQRGQERFDSMASSWSLADADRRLLSELCQAFALDPAIDTESRVDALEERGMVVSRGGNAMLTIAGALFLVPSAPEQLGKCFVEVFRYGDGSTAYEQRFTYEGTPAEQVREATTRIEEELGFDLVFIGGTRHELRRLPLKALREVLANAVAHRDYQLSGSAVEVHIRSGEVMVRSPGGFVAPVTSENLRNAHAARNRRIIHALRAFRLAEDAGLGIGVILEEMSHDLRPEPSFAEEVPGFVTVRLPIESPVLPEERAWIREQEARDSLLPLDRRVLIEAARGTVLTNASVRSLLGVDSDKARQSLQRLRDAGFLEQRGERRATSYRIVPSVARPTRTLLDKAELMEAICQLAETGPITNAIVQERLGLSRRQALTLLTELVTEERLELRGSKRGSHYVPRGTVRVQSRLEI